MRSKYKIDVYWFDPYKKVQKDWTIPARNKKEVKSIIKTLKSHVSHDYFLVRQVKEGKMNKIIFFTMLGISSILIGCGDNPYEPYSSDRYAQITDQTSSKIELQKRLTELAIRIRYFC